MKDNNNTVKKFVLPVHFASWLINDDASGLSNADAKAIDNFIVDNDINHCIDADVDNTFFAKKNDLNNLGGDVCVFSFI